MVLKEKLPAKQKRLRKIIIKPDGVLWDVEKNSPLACAMDLYENCFGRCRWLSIDENKIARCQDNTIGKLIAYEKT